MDSWNLVQNATKVRSVICRLLFWFPHATNFNQQLSSSFQIQSSLRLVSRTSGTYPVTDIVSFAPLKKFSFISKLSLIPKTRCYVADIISLAVSIQHFPLFLAFNSLRLVSRTMLRIPFLFFHSTFLSLFQFKALFDTKNQMLCCRYHFFSSLHSSFPSFSRFQFPKTGITYHFADPVFFFHSTFLSLSIQSYL